MTPGSQVRILPPLTLSLPPDARLSAQTARSQTQEGYGGRLGDGRHDDGIWLAPDERGSLWRRELIVVALCEGRICCWFGVRRV